MAKRRNKAQSAEETKAAEESREREQIAYEADAAAELLQGEEYPFLNRMCTKAGRTAAIALAKVMADGTVTTKKGGEVLLSDTSQLAYAKHLAWVLNFTREFLESPQAALNLQIKLEARDRDKQEQMDAQEFNEDN